MLRPKVLGFLVIRILRDNDLKALEQLFNENNIAIGFPYNEYSENAIMTYQNVALTTPEMTKFLVEKSLDGVLNKNTLGLTVLDIALINKQKDFYKYFCKFCPKVTLSRLKEMSLNSDKVNLCAFTNFNELKDFYFNNEHQKGKLTLTADNLKSLGFNLSDLRKNPEELNKAFSAVLSS